MLRLRMTRGALLVVVGLALSTAWAARDAPALAPGEPADRLEDPAPSLRALPADSPSRLGRSADRAGEHRSTKDRPGPLLAVVAAALVVATARRGRARAATAVPPRQAAGVDAGQRAPPHPPLAAP